MNNRQILEKLIDNISSYSFIHDDDIERYIRDIKSFIEYLTAEAVEYPLSFTEPLCIGSSLSKYWTLSADNPFDLLSRLFTTQLMDGLVFGLNTWRIPRELDNELPEGIKGIVDTGKKQYKGDWSPSCKREFTQQIHNYLKCTVPADSSVAGDVYVPENKDEYGRIGPEQKTLNAGDTCYFHVTSCPISQNIYARCSSEITEGNSCNELVDTTVYGNLFAEQIALYEGGPVACWAGIPLRWLTNPT